MGSGTLSSGHDEIVYNSYACFPVLSSSSSSFEIDSGVEFVISAFVDRPLYSTCDSDMQEAVSAIVSGIVSGQIQ